MYDQMRVCIVSTPHVSSLTICLQNYILSDFKKFFQLLETHYPAEDKAAVDLTLPKVRAQLEFEHWQLSSAAPANNADVAS